MYFTSSRFGTVRIKHLRQTDYGNDGSIAVSAVPDGCPMSSSTVEADAVLSSSAKVPRGRLGGLSANTMDVSRLPPSSENFSCSDFSAAHTIITRVGYMPFVQDKM